MLSTRPRDALAPLTQRAVDARFAWERRRVTAAAREPVARDRLVRLTRRYLRRRRRWEATSRVAGHPTARAARRYSQNGEDGIIGAILDRLRIASGAFVELGAADGNENCTRALAATGRWRGVWIEGDPELARRAAEIAGPLGVTAVNAFVDRDNVVAAVRDGGGLGDASPDVLVIDVDGNDWHLWREVARVWQPALVVAEYNSGLGPSVDWVMPYDARHVWQTDRYQGATLRAFDRLARELGYALVACEAYGANAFWVRADLAGPFPLAGAIRRQYAPYAYAMPTGLPWCAAPSPDCAALSDAQLGAIRLARAELVVPPAADGANAIVVDVENGSGVPITSHGLSPVRIAARWGPTPDADAWTDPARGDLTGLVAPGAQAAAVVLLGPQTHPFATVELVQDNVRWGHDLPDGALRVDAVG